MKILIVEDEMIISEDICMMLEDQGYEVIGQAVDYNEAIEIFKSKGPDLVLLDINLIGTHDGVQVAQKINELGRVPFIFTSSLSDGNTIARVKATNPSAYLVKPFKEEQLIASIEVALANYSKDKGLKPEEEKITVFNDAIFVKVEHRFVKVRLSDIVYIQKSDNYIDIVTSDNKYVVRSSIGGFMDQLDDDSFARTHRSYAININFITDVAATMVRLGDVEIPLAKTHADYLMARLRII